MNTRFYITENFDASKITALLKDEPDYTDIFEENAADLIQIAAIDRNSGSYVGFLSCTNDNDHDTPAMMNAFTAPPFRNLGVFSEMYAYLTHKYSFSSIICPMDDVIYSILKHTEFKPVMYSHEYLLTICRNDFQKNISNRHIIDYDIISEAVSDTCICYQICDDEYVIGELYIDSFEYTGCMYDVWVDPEHRKKGIATKLVNYALNDYYSIKDNSNNSIILHVTGSNTAAINLYKKCGFDELSCSTYYEMH